MDCRTTDEVRASFQRKDTLCWTCQVPGTSGCAWDRSKGKTPVNGWVAIPTLLRSHNRGETPLHSYRVLACPLYRPDRTQERAK